MDPVETRHFSTEIMRAIDEQGLTAAYERGSSLEPDQAMVSVEELVGEALTEHELDGVNLDRTGT